MPPDLPAATTPAAVILACDARAVRPLYADDQIWELRIREAGPGVLAVQTTFGLRARTMRIFPRFLSGSAVVDDPAQFSSPPRAVWIGTSYCALEYAPFPGIDVTGEYWVPESRVLAGRIRISNHREAASTCRLELAAQLVPLEGQAMSAAHAQVSATLRGQTGSLYPVLFLTGGPDTGSGLYPSLILDFKLPPGDSRQVGWALASLDDANRSSELARQATARPWPAEIARLKMRDASDQVVIDTGDPAWDAVLAHSQRAARRLLHGPGSGLPETSFVLARIPDQGYSRRGDGSEYNYLWSGQTALEACMLASSLLPGAADVAAGFLRNFLAVQAADGSIDWKPGLAGQRGKLLAQPVLAELAWRIFRANGDTAFLAGVYDPLMRFLAAWLSPEHDRDADGVPEWDHLVQNGFEDSPLFNRWLPGAQGMDIQLVETPGLASLLYNECRSLERIAEQLGKTEDLAQLEETAARLAAAVQSTWDEERGTFHHRDRDSHLTQTGEAIYRGQGPGDAQLDLHFDARRRLVIRMRIGTETTRPVHIRILGEDAGGKEIEEAFTIR
ncbi:MAG TPA: hypothetical protein VF813_06480, partial [Anaerolineaceae bacterium]